MITSVAVQISGDFLDAEEVTKLLNILPTFSQNKGDIKKRGGVAKTGVWRFSLKAGEEFSIYDCAEALRVKFGRACEILKNLPNSEYAWVDICVVVESREKNFDFSMLMSREAVSIFENFGLPVDFTFYVSLEEQELKDAC